MADQLETYEQRVTWMFLTQTEMWTFTHQHQMSSSSMDADFRRRRAEVAAQLGLEVERAMLACIGTKRRRTYGHDTVYGLPKLYMLLGKLPTLEHARATSTRTRK